MGHPLTVFLDAEADAVTIEFEPGVAGYAKKLDDWRFVDYSLNPGRPIGVSLHRVSQGVQIGGLPEPDRIRSILEGLEVKVLP